MLVTGLSKRTPTVTPGVFEGPGAAAGRGSPIKSSTRDDDPFGFDSILSLMSEPQVEPITPESLAGERCTELPAGTPPLTTEDAHLLAGAISREWNVGGTEVRREFTFKTFNAAFGLATRIALLAESHLSLHAWPELGYVALDVFTCGEADPQKIVEQLEEHFRPRDTEYIKIPRGRMRAGAFATLELVLITEPV